MTSEYSSYFFLLMIFIICIFFIEEFKQANTSLKDINTLIHQQTQLLNSQLKKIKMVNEKAYKLLYPHGSFSKAKRSLNEILNKNFYTKEEARMLDELSMSIDDFYSILDKKENLTHNHHNIN